MFTLCIVYAWYKHFYSVLRSSPKCIFVVAYNCDSESCYNNTYFESPDYDDGYSDAGMCTIEITPYHKNEEGSKEVSEAGRSQN